jgi:sortase A
VTAVDSRPTDVSTRRTAPVLIDLSVSEPRTVSSQGALTRPPALRSLALAIPVAIAVFALWFLLFAFELTPFQEHAAQNRLYDRLRLELAEATAPLAEPIRAGDPVALISADSAGMRNVVVVEGTTSALLRQGPGHLGDTPLPGQVGNSVLLGRSVTYGAPFGKVTELKQGDQLTVTTGQGVFEYRVEDVRYPGDRLPPLLKDQQSRLTFVTSSGSGWGAGWAPTRTAYVDALLVKGKAQAVPAGGAGTVTNSSLPMKGDPSGAVALIFWIEALSAGVVALAWAWVRWGRAQTWMAGAPVLLGLLWGTSDAVMRLLPNLL